MRYHPSHRNIVWTVLFSILAALSLDECSDTSKAPAPPPGPTALTITSTSPLPSGSINIRYSTTLAADGGNPGYTWSLAPGSPALPNGLSLSTAGVISGTPTTLQTVSPVFRVQDSTKPTPTAVQATLTISINAVPQPTITTPSPLPSGIVNHVYSSTTLTAVGGTPPYTWSATVTPALPSGLTFNAATATISGIPTATETNVTHTFSVTDSFFPTPQAVSKGLALTVSPAPLTLAISTSSPLPVGTVTQVYGPVQLAASGGTPPFTWDLAPGSPALPNGLQLSSAGVLSGTPSTAVNVSPVFRVRDAATSPQQTATKTLAISIVLPTPLSITTSTLPNGVLNQAYSSTVQATGGSGTRTWSFQGGNIPNLTINSSTGLISGNPTPTGNFNFTVQVTDALFTATKNFTIAITAPPAPRITTSSLPIGTVNIPYSAQLQAINGAPPLNFQPVGLPFGLTFNVTPNSSTATITGTPTSDGSQNVTFTVNDSTVPFNQTGSATLTLAVNKALTISTPSPLPSGTKDSPYSFQLAASGGTPLPGPSYSWSLVNGFPALPPGLTLHPSGLIDGTPTNTVNVTVTPRFRVQDAVPTAVTKDLTITVNATLMIDTTSPLTPGIAGQPYSFQLVASGGTGPGTYTWTLSDPDNFPLPTGFTLDPTGLLSGTSTAAGSYTLKFTVTDQTSPTPQSKSTTLTLTLSE